MLHVPLVNCAVAVAGRVAYIGFMPKRRHLQHQQHGFSLLEILVSIVVLTFGLLGTVGLQFSALQGNRDANLQSTAVRLGRELTELMRDNKNVALLTTAAANPYLVSFNGTLPTSLEDCLSVSCSTELAIAQWGIRDWLQRVSNELPGARVEVCYDAAPFDADGLPKWGCSSSGGVAMVKIGWARRSTDLSKTGQDAIEQASKPSVVLPVAAGAGV